MSHATSLRTDFFDEPEYRVFHPEFDEDRIYTPIAHFDYGETAWDKILFINERGMTYSVRVDRTLCVNALAFSRQIHHYEKAIPKPQPRGYNPDLHTD
jgi:hypothetical protein